MVRVTYPFLSFHKRDNKPIRIKTINIDTYRLSKEIKVAATNHFFSSLVLLLAVQTHLFLIQRYIKMASRGAAVVTRQVSGYRFAKFMTYPRTTNTLRNPEDQDGLIISAE